MPTYDGENLIITLDAGATNIDWIDVYSDWKDWLLSDPYNRAYPEAFRTTGGDPLNLFLNAGSYWFLRNDLGWRIRPPEENITILASGNLAPEDAAIDMFLPTVGAYTTQILGLQPVTQGFSAELAAGLEHNAYNEGITLDVINGTNGTSFPIGTPQTPCKTIENVAAINAMKGFNRIYVRGDWTPGATDNLDNFSILGENPQKTEIILTAGCSTEGCEISDCTISGTLDGDTWITNAVVGNLTYIEGNLVNCTLVGTITLAGTGIVRILDCIDGTPGEDGLPMFDMGGSGRDIILTNYNGAANFKNMTGANKIDANFVGGHLHIESTISAGEVLAHGVGDVHDYSTGTAVVDSTGLLSNDSIAAAVWGADDMALLLKLIRNKKVVAKTGLTWQLIVFDNDGTTPILTKDLKDPTGQEIADMDAGTLAQELASIV